MEQEVNEFSGGTGNGILVEGNSKGTISPGDLDGSNLTGRWSSRELETNTPVTDIVSESGKGCSRSSVDRKVDGGSNNILRNLPEAWKERGKFIGDSHFEFSFLSSSVPIPILSPLLDHQAISNLLEGSACKCHAHTRAPIDKLPGEVHGGYHHTLVRRLDEGVYGEVVRFVEDWVYILRVHQGASGRGVEAIREHKGVVEHKVITDAALGSLILLAISPEADDADVGCGGRNVVALEATVAGVGHGQDIRFIVAVDH